MKSTGKVALVGKTGLQCDIRDGIFPGESASGMIQTALHEVGMRSHAGFATKKPNKMTDRTPGFSGNPVQIKRLAEPFRHDRFHLPHLDWITANRNKPAIFAMPLQQQADTFNERLPDRERIVNMHQQGMQLNKFPAGLGVAVQSAAEFGNTLPSLPGDIIDNGGIHIHGMQGAAVCHGVIGVHLTGSYYAETVRLKNIRHPADRDPVTAKPVEPKT